MALRSLTRGFFQSKWLVRFISDMFDNFFEVIVWLMCYSRLRNITHMALYFDIMNLDTLNTSISKSHSLRNVVHTKSISPLSALKWQDGEHFCRNRRGDCFPGEFDKSMTWMFDFCIVSFIKKKNEPCGLNVCDSLLQMNKIKIQIYLNLSEWNVAHYYRQELFPDEWLTVTVKHLHSKWSVAVNNPCKKSIASVNHRHFKWKQTIKCRRKLWGMWRVTCKLFHTIYEGCYL